MSNVAYNQDCLEAMREMDDNAFDLAIVDPPYGIGDKWVRPGENCYKAAAMAGERWDYDTPDAEYFRELFRVSANQIVWGGNYFELPPTRGVICWDKVQPYPNFSAWELAWTSFDCVARIYKGRSTDLNRIHPTQKPVALYKWLLQNYAKQGDRVLDTHLGSGSSRIACYDLGFDFTGYELDADYFQAQEERFARHTAQQTLFVPESKPVQEAMFV